MQNDTAPLRFGTVFKQIDRLPGSQHRAAILYGIDRLVCVSAALMWAGISSGPSVVWR